MSTPPSNLVESANAEPTLPVLSVGEVSALVKRAVEEGFPRVRVKGEISGLTRAQSGHLYFTLKDDDAVLDGVCWRATAARLALSPDDGMEVVATGRLTTYAQRSRYQIIIDSLELAGEGALLKLLEERRKKLAAEGLFDPDAKKPLPFLPGVIGVVTSPTGAVIRDILHRLDDRFPRHVLLWPVTVQGDGAADQITAAIRGFNRLKRKGRVPKPDLLIVARGGGSLEDLWAFNEENVVRAAAASRIPLISAVGHETDTTLVDFAADARAPTPSAAAEMAVPVRSDLLAMVADDGARLVSAAARLIEDGRTRLDGLARGLPDVGRLVEAFIQRLDEWTDRLRYAIGVGMDGHHAELARLTALIPKPHDRIAHGRSRLKSETRALKSAARTLVREHRRALGQAAALLESASYERVLERGFVLVTGEAGETVQSVARLAPGDNVMLGFRDGKADATVTGVGGRSGGRRKETKKKRPLPRRKPSADDDPQGTLL